MYFYNCCIFRGKKSPATFKPDVSCEQYQPFHIQQAQDWKGNSESWCSEDARQTRLTGHPPLENANYRPATWCARHVGSPGELPRLLVLALLGLSSSHVLYVRESRLCGVPADDKLSWQTAGHKANAHLTVRWNAHLRNAQEFLRNWVLYFCSLWSGCVGKWVSYKYFPQHSCSCSSVKELIVQLQWCLGIPDTFSNYELAFLMATVKST